MKGKSGAMPDKGTVEKASGAAVFRLGKSPKKDLWGDAVTGFQEKNNLFQFPYLKHQGEENEDGESVIPKEQIPSKEDQEEGNSNDGDSIL